MAKYARETEVPAERSRSEIEQTLKKYGATSFGYGWQESGAIVVFEFKGRRMKFSLPMPDESFPNRGKEERRRWRSLLLSIKAKLVTVDDGISTVETEFMGHIILPNGMTVSEWMHPQIDTAYRDGKMPPLLGSGVG
jgi:hypothetical protein